MRKGRGEIEVKGLEKHRVGVDMCVSIGLWWPSSALEFFYPPASILKHFYPRAFPVSLLAVPVSLLPHFQFLSSRGSSFYPRTVPVSILARFLSLRVSSFLPCTFPVSLLARFYFYPRAFPVSILTRYPGGMLSMCHSVWLWLWRGLEIGIPALPAVSS